MIALERITVEKINSQLKLSFIDTIDEADPTQSREIL